jgi:signal peptidase II
MRYFYRWVALLALLVLAVDELVKTVARVRLAPCPETASTLCDSLQVVGPLWLVRTANAGSALGFGQGWWIWLLLAVVGLLLIPLYARMLRGGRVAVLAVGLQVGGALGNLLDRLALGGASDVFYIAGWRFTWNRADVAIGVGTLFAVWALVRRHGGATATTPAAVA